jgi:hypothetical protein
MYKNGIVFFIDILGSKNMQDFQKRLDVNKIFHEKMKENQLNDEILSYTIYERKVYVFSDCAYIIYAFKESVEDTKKDILKLLKIALYNTSFLMLKILKHCVLCRGGITIGDVYFENDRSLFFGPAIDRAYKLESIKGSHPRLIIDNNIAKEFLDHESNFVNSAPNVFKKIISGTNGNIILKDTDGLYYLNYFNSMRLGHVYSEINSFNDYHNMLVENSKNTVILFKKKLKTASTDKEKKNISSVINKHNWFLEYLETSKPPQYPNKVIMIDLKKIE